VGGVDGVTIGEKVGSKVMGGAVGSFVGRSVGRGRVGTAVPIMGCFVVGATGCLDGRFDNGARVGRLETGSLVGDGVGATHPTGLGVA
jgi:hypothetical protein